MLHGMGEPIQQALAADGNRVRVYTPYGAMLPGMAYLVRRLLENTSNESFLKASFTANMPGRGPACAIPRRSVPCGNRMLGPKARPSSNGAGRAPARPFANEPLDRLHPPREPRAAMQQALDDVRGQLGRSYPLTIGGEDGPADRDVRVDRPRRLRPRSSAGLPQGDPGARPAGRRRRSRAFAGLVDARRRATADVLVRAAAIMRRDGSSWRPGRSSSAASPGARPTATSPRRSTSASSTPAR